MLESVVLRVALAAAVSLWMLPCCGRVGGDEPSGRASVPDEHLSGSADAATAAPPPATTAELPAGAGSDAGAGVPASDEDTSLMLPRVREQGTSSPYWPSDSAAQDAGAPSPPRLLSSEQKAAILQRLTKSRGGDGSVGDGKPFADAGSDSGADPDGGQMPGEGGT